MDLQAQSFEEFERETLGMLEPPAAAQGPAAYEAPAGPFVSQFGAVPYYARYENHGQRHEWLIKGVLTRGEQGMLVGASQAGKSFLALDMAMSIARGVPWMDCKTRRGLVIYHAGESAKGVRDKRIPAYDKANNMADDADIPFVLLTKLLDLYNSDDDTTKLIAECRYWASRFPEYPFELLVIDTFAAATPGADENAGKDVGNIRRRCKRIEQELGCAVLLVHHKNAAGTKARGHSSMFADVENVLDVSLCFASDSKEKDPPVLRDVQNRKVRVAKVTKLKDGGDEREWRFTLESVKLGEDEDGDPVTSCVIGEPDMGTTEPNAHEAATKGQQSRLPKPAYMLLKCIEEATRQHGRSAPEDVPAPRDVDVVERQHVTKLFRARFFDDKYSDEAKREKALREILSNAGLDLSNRGYITKHNNWVWRTSRRLPGEKRRDAAAREAAPELAPDEDEGLPEIGAGMDWLQEGGE